MPPIHEYKCVCGHKFERLIRKKPDDLPKTCPKCHGVEFRKVLSLPNFRIHGSGVYAPTSKME